MNTATLRQSLIVFFVTLLVSFSPVGLAESAGEDAQQEEPEKGPHRGRMLRDGDFALELSIFETGVPPEFRVWLTDNESPVLPADVDVKITLTRLGDKKDHISFRPQEDFLRGDMEIYEPHSFLVTIQASYKAKQYQWQYDNFEGRVRIAPDVAQAMDILTAAAKSQEMVERASVFGRVIPDVNAMQHLSARFDGVVKAIHVSLGQQVSAGTPLLTIESNESLKPYTLHAPNNGEVTAVSINVGEATGNGSVVTILDQRRLVVELKVFPHIRKQLAVGNSVVVHGDGVEDAVLGKVIHIANSLNGDQSADVRVAIPAQSSALLQGQFITAEIEVARYTVDLAVKRAGLQSFRDFTVVYAKVGDEYEVRMLELGREAGEWVEVLGGLESGTEYVAENSYIIKADIEKSGASHDH